MEKEYLYAMNMDNCPDTDAIIDRTMCGGCPYYRGVQVENALPCVRCTYYSQNENQENN